MRAILAIVVCCVLPLSAAAQDANYLLPIDTLEHRLKFGPLNVVDARGARAPGDRTQRIALSYEDGSTLVAQLAVAPRNGSTFNNEPRYELAAYEIQRLFLDPDDYVVPPTVVRAAPVEFVRQHDPRAVRTFDSAESTVIVLQYWLLQVTPDNFYDRDRARQDTLYARHLGNFNILTYLIRHNDSNVGNFLISEYAGKPRVFSVDNGVAFTSQVSDRGYEWRNMRVERLPRATVERLRAITPEQLRERLGVLVQFQATGGFLETVEPGANLNAGRGVRRADGIIQFGLTDREIRGIESRLRDLLEDIDKGDIEVF
ncbi:MAG TPA: hypothetical protein VMM79_10060 [Longimicrobiales bacterium]|nr:hypothetical protein [Longimicrobiales bacterium]